MSSGFLGSFSRLSMYFYSMCFWKFSCVCLLLKKSWRCNKLPQELFQNQSETTGRDCSLDSYTTSRRSAVRGSKVLFQKRATSRCIILVGNEGNNSQWFGGACILCIRIYIYMNINCMHSIYTVRFVIYCSCFISYRTFRYSNNFRIQALRAFKISSFSICNLKVRMILFHFEGALFFSKKPSV